ncbi:MAG TPA: hypothetical protein VD997_16155 [Phycisphaerales bacterium]|nr:hypothetical protein [Phycisphaerales bacterium]
MSHSLDRDCDAVVRTLEGEPAPDPMATPLSQAVDAETEIAGQGSPEPSQRKSQATLLIDLVLTTPGLELFHCEDGEAYATFPVGDHVETWRLSNRGFREWLMRQFYELFGKAASAQALQDAISTLSGEAKFKGPQRQVCLRVAGLNGLVYLDLCDKDWRAIEVSPSGWRVINSTTAPIRFFRRRGMHPLPSPQHGGSIEQLRPLVNLPEDEQWVLFVGWLVGALRPTGPYGVLNVDGEQGSAKSTLCKMARRLIDPNEADLRRPPRDERDVFISAGNGWMCCYNNLSDLKPHLSDAICALATDGGFATRTLYENDDETIFKARRPVLLNGIEDVADRSDLIDRTVRLSLSPIAADVRLSETEIWRKFDEIRPAVLGALLTAVSAALRNFNSVRLPVKPRMADFAIWVTAAEEGLGWYGGRFMAAYMANREGANASAVESSPVGAAVLQLLAQQPHWSGTGAELLDHIRVLTADPLVREWHGAAGAKSLIGALRRLAPNLRAMGVEVNIPVKGSGKFKRKIIQLEHRRTAGSAHPAASADQGEADGAEGADPDRTPCSNGIELAGGTR